MVARELRIAQVIIPRAPGHFSAFGMLVADLRRDFVNTWFTPLADASFDEMESIYRRDGDARPRGGRGSGSPSPAVAVQRAADMRYVGQEHAVTVELPVELFQSEDRDGDQAAFRCRARDALRLFGAGGEGRDRQPAQRRHRR